MRTVPEKSHAELGAALALGAFLAALAWFALANPVYTWDVVPYVATALAPGSDGPEAIHAATFELLRQSLSAIQFNALVTGDYAATMLASPESFASQLVMYEIKPLYVFALRSLTVVGVNPVEGVIWLALVPGLLFCLILYLWLRQLAGPVQAALLVMLFAICARLFDLSRIPTPDNLSALTLLAGLWFLLARNQLAGATLCLVLSIWVRTNNILLVAPLLLLLCWNHLHRTQPVRSREFAAFASGLFISMVSYLWISFTYDYQWWRLFYHTLVASLTDLEAFADPFSLSQYLEVIQGSLLKLVSLDPDKPLFDTNLVLFILLGILAWGRSWRAAIHNFRWPSQAVSLAEVAALCLPIVISYLLLFPLISGLDRLLTACYAIFTIFCVAAYSKSEGQYS